MQKFYLKVVNKTKNWYTTESKELTAEVSKRNMDSFLVVWRLNWGLMALVGSIPFSGSSIDWAQYNED